MFLVPKTNWRVVNKSMEGRDIWVYIGVLRLDDFEHKIMSFEESEFEKTAVEMEAAMVQMMKALRVTSRALETRRTREAGEPRAVREAREAREDKTAREEFRRLFTFDKIQTRKS